MTKRRVDAMTGAWVRMVGLATVLVAVLPRHLTAVQCPDGTPPPCRGARVSPAPLPSVAVLVFESRSRDSNDVYLAEGISDELTTRLGRLGKLAVRSESAARNFHAGTQSPQEIGRALNVTYLATGTVRRGGPRVRVSVELTRAATAERVWGEQYDRATDDVLRTEDEVAEAIATAIAGHLAPAERARLSRAPTANNAAWDHYLRGMFQFRKRNSEAMNIAWTEFSAAVSLDPSFADAHAQLGAVGNISGFMHHTVAGMSADSVFARGERETQIALRLDSASAQAWANLSTIRSLRYPQTYAGVKEAVDRALALDSLGDQINFVAGGRYATLGDIPTALRLFRRAHEADPLNGLTMAQMVFGYWRLGRLAEALAAVDSFVALSSTGRGPLGLRALLRVAAGDTAGARRDLASAITFGGTLETEERVARIWVGDTSGAGQHVDSLRTGFSRSAEFRYGFDLAILLLTLGDRAGALDVLERIQPRSISLGATLRNIPVFDPLANEPRFRALLAEMRPPAASR